MNTVNEKIEQQRARKNARSRQHYQENKEKRAAYYAAKYQQKKAAVPDFLAIQAAKAAERRRKDPTISQKANTRRRKKDPELARAQSREWFASNPDKRRIYEQNRRARKRALKGRVSPNIHSKLMVLQKRRCACCLALISKKSSSLDHIAPLFKGGCHDDSNLQLLCRPCNGRKYNKDPIAFMQANGKLI